MSKRILGGVAILAAIGTLGVAATASGSLLSGVYAGKITGINGAGIAGFKGGNMKFKICNCGRIERFEFSKIRVGCTDGNLWRTSGKVAPAGRAFIRKGVRQFKFHRTNQYGGVLNVRGVFRGNDHARGFLRYKGRMATTGGVKTCTTETQFWSAGHVG